VWVYRVDAVRHFTFEGLETFYLLAASVERNTPVCELAVGYLGRVTDDGLPPAP
jgi:hypothetical protein